METPKNNNTELMVACIRQAEEIEKLAKPPGLGGLNENDGLTADALWRGRIAMATSLFQFAKTDELMKNMAGMVSSIMDFGREVIKAKPKKSKNKSRK